MPRRGYHIRISVDKSSHLSSVSTSYNTRTLNNSGIYIPHSLFEPLPSHPSRTLARRNTLHHPHHRGGESSSPASRISQEHLDYRYGPIRLDWIDFENMENSIVTKKPSVGKEKQGSARGPAVASFIQNRNKTGSTNLPEGVVHIFRDVPKSEEDQQRDASFPPLPSSSTIPIPRPSSSSTTEVPEVTVADGILLGVLAVPSWMTPSDFLTFVAPATDGMTHLRMIRDSAPNRSIVVISFRTEANAAEFTEAYNGKPFNSMEPEICHVVRILSIAIDTDEFSGQGFTYPVPSSTSYELPTCPVCLERMDSAVTGLITVPCSHTFHCACLSKWGDSRCPVCRYSQTLLSSHPTSANTSRSTVPFPFTTSSSSSSSSSSSHCVDCPPSSPSTTNLWICLICGNIGCGRYRRAHAQAHYERTTHLYALEIETQRVWDYAGDGYVHRLIQNKADGKLVELPSAAMGGGGDSREGGGGGGGGGGPSAADALSAEKIEAIGIEYSYLLTSQLDSQRTYYEDQIRDLRTQVEEFKTILETIESEKSKSKHQEQEQQLRQSQLELECLKYKAEIETQQETILSLQKSNEKAFKQISKSQTFEKQLQEERTLSQNLLKNLSIFKDRTTTLERSNDTLQKQNQKLMKEVGELKDQVRDIMFFLETRDKIEDGQGVVGEAAGGSIEISTHNNTGGTQNASSETGNGKKKGKKKNK
ncbi:hypothetical protein ABKN59_009219 [Abortiporus biennis]